MLWRMQQVEKRIDKLENKFWQIMLAVCGTACLECFQLIQVAAYHMQTLQTLRGQ
jgi:hypothetical protein